MNKLIFHIKLPLGTSAWGKFQSSSYGSDCTCSFLSGKRAKHFKKLHINNCDGQLNKTFNYKNLDFGHVERDVKSLFFQDLYQAEVEDKFSTFLTGSGVSCNHMIYFYLQLRRDGVLLLRGLDSRLSKDLPSDLQKLRCMVV